MNFPSLTPPRLVLLGMLTVLVLWCAASLAFLSVQRYELSRVWGEIESLYETRFALLSEAQIFVGSSNDAAEPLRAALTARDQWTLAASLTEKIAALNAFETNLQPVLQVLNREPAAVDVSIRFRNSARQIAALQAVYNQKTQLFNARLNVFPRSLLKFPLGIRPFSGFRVNLDSEIEGTL